ncbi:MAG: hypothetical protein AAB471_01570 [Patescibacteria group bacterium]
MTILYTSLIVHIIAGLVGVISAFALLIGLLHRVPKIRSLKIWSVITFFSFILSWATGAYYYVLYYGKAVKPVILAGGAPWAHKIVMEAKEHVFLFIPFVAFVIMVGIFAAPDAILGDRPIKKSLAWLSAFVFVLGALIALAGVAISGAARQ